MKESGFKPCWLRDGCPCMSAVCSSAQPDGEDCPVYRWFQKLISGKETVRAEYEGDARTDWWYVCEECHTRIDTSDRFCRQCGRRILWG